MRPRTGALSVMVSTHRANRLAALRARRTVSSKDNRAGHVDFHKHPGCVWFINGSYSKSRGGGVGRGWGQPGLEKLRIAGQTGSIPVACANVYRSLALLGCSSVAKVSAELGLLGVPVRSSLACTLGNTEIPTCSPGHPLVTSHTSLILPGQSKSLVSSTLSLVKLGCHPLSLPLHRYPASLS